MAQTIEEYRVFHYYKCNLSLSYLSTWQGLAYPSHIIQIVTFPIQILTFYMIMKHTPVHMKSLKWSILVNHFWCTWLDFIICGLSTPYVFLPYLGFLGVGALSWFGISYLYQLVVAILVAFGTASSYIYLFESRSFTLQENRFKFTRQRSRIIYHVSLFLIDLPLLFSLSNVPTNQNAAKLKLLSWDPCPTPEFFLPDVFIVTTDVQTIYFYICGFLPFLLFHAASHILFHAGCTIYYIFIAPSNVISPYTRQCQRQFFVGMIFQTGIPVVLLAAPITHSLFIFFMGTYDQAWMNLGVIISGFHGMGESLAILIVHNSYRKAILKMVPTRKRKQSQSINIIGTW